MTPKFIEVAVVFQEFPRAIAVDAIRVVQPLSDTTCGLVFEQMSDDMTVIDESYESFVARLTGGGSAGVRRLTESSRPTESSNGTPLESKEM